MRKIIYILTAVVIVAWVVFRFSAIGSENGRHVFNASRAAQSAGLPIETIVARNESGVLQEPLFIKDNRALVSGSRVARFRAGQKIGGGEIVSVGRNIDLDTGMHIIKTRGAADGEQFVSVEMSGFFMPLSAVHNDIVFVAQDGTAAARKIKIIGSDLENAVVTGELKDGDIIILSNVKNGDKVKGI